MAVWKFEDKVPKIGKSSYVAESADIIGDVTVGSDCYIGPGARIRGDYGRIEIGSGVSIQENVVIHARPDEKTIIGNHVTAGHGCILHNCTLKEYSLVGMGAVVSDYAVLGKWSILGENSLASNGQEIKDYDIAVGSPAKVIGSVKDKESTKKYLIRFKKKYAEMAGRHLKEGALKRIS